MRTVFLLLLLAVPAGRMAAQSGSTSIMPLRIADERLAAWLLTAEQVPILTDSGSPAPLFAKLWRRGHQGSCVDGTHWLCEYDYYLVYSDYGEYEEPFVYHLGRVGEILSARWTSQDVPARLAIHVVNFPEHALKQQTDLTRQEARIVLEVGYTSVRLLGTP